MTTKELVKSRVAHVTLGTMEVSILRLLVSVLLPSAISLWGLRRRSLSSSGALLALAVGFLVTLTNGCLCAAMMAFFFSSSRLTKWKGHVKRKMEHDYKEGKDIYE